MKPMRLRIEGGILLKPYTLPWRPGGYDHVRGWTADEGNEWVQRRQQELMDDYRRKVEGDDVEEAVFITAEYLFLQQAVREHGQYLQERREPWPGWVPVVYAKDKKIGDAYRRMFVAINPDYMTLPDHMRSAAKWQWPPDGDYEFDGKEMRPVEVEEGGEQA